MAAYDLEEQEQLDEIKAWWKAHGNKLINVITAIAVAAALWQGWGWYQNRQIAQASVIFSVLQKGIEENDAQKIKAASGELLDKFSGTSYASLGALAASKAMVEMKDLSSAKLQLTWLVDKGEKEMRDLGRLRLATLLLEEKQFDDALKQLEAAPLEAYAARFAETRGDIYAAQGKKTEAAAAYQSAVKKLSDSASEQKMGRTGGIYREILRQKLDSMGGEK